MMNTGPISQLLANIMQLATIGAAVICGNLAGHSKVINPAQASRQWVTINPATV